MVEFMPVGIAQGESVRRIGVDQGTLARWERGEREPTHEFAVRAKRFLAETEANHPIKTA
jgi:transcriptional regulator with XRE-family HTH domain